MVVGVCWQVLCAVFHGKIQVVVTITAYPGEGKKHVNGLCVMSGGGAGFMKALVRVRCLQASRVVRGSAACCGVLRGRSAGSEESSPCPCLLPSEHARPLTSATLLGRVSACALEEVNSSFNFGSALLRHQIRCFTLSPLGQSFRAVNNQHTMILSSLCLTTSHHPKLYLLSTEYTNSDHSPVTAHAAACKSLSCGLSPYARLST